MNNIKEASSFAADSVAMSNDDKKLAYLQTTGIYILDCGCWTGEQRNFGLICEDELAILDVSTKKTYIRKVAFSSIFRATDNYANDHVPKIEEIAARLATRTSLEIKIIRSKKLRPWFANELDGSYKVTYPGAPIAFIPDTHIGMTDAADDFCNYSEDHKGFKNYSYLINLLQSLRAEGIGEIIQLGDYMDIWEAEATVIINDYICAHWTELSHFFQLENLAQIKPMIYYMESYLRYVDYRLCPPELIFDRAYGRDSKTLHQILEARSAYYDSELSFRAYISIMNSWCKKIVMGLGPIQSSFSHMLQGNHDFRIATTYEAAKQDLDLLYVGSNKKIRVEHGHRYDTANNTFLNPSNLDNTTANTRPPKWKVVGLWNADGKRVTWDLYSHEATTNSDIENNWWNTLAWEENVELMRERMAQYWISQIPEDAITDSTKRKSALLKFPRIITVGHTHYPDILFLPILFFGK